MTKILITGGAGFIGSHVVELLQKSQHDILVLDDFSTGKMQNIAHLTTRNNLHVVDHDISTMPNLRTLFVQFKPEIVIHLAAQAAITTAKDDPIRDLQVNGLGTLNLLTVAEHYQVRHFVYASTSAVYGNKNYLRPVEEKNLLAPDNEYGISKLTGEHYVRLSGIPAAILRFGNVYGPRQVPIGENQVIARMIRHFENGDEFYIFGDGKQKRDFVFVEDVAHAVKVAMGHSGIYNIASGKSVSVNDIGRTVARIYELHDYPWDHDRARQDSRMNVRMNVNAAWKGLAWKARVSLEEGLRRTVEE
ncbi:MAG: NAD-dependent epimerase/dehydratase family protein [Deltaproteobacteria bacterium]|nr:NAD-dependent epimerase/dehydratase family protein [Deltaproteobacteria bacterium]